MDGAWTEFLRGANGPEHAAQVYADVEELAASVAASIAVGFASDQPALVLATRAHWAVFAEHLGACGWDAGRLADEGLLVVADAEETLARLVDGEGRIGERFDATVGSLVADLADRFPGTTIRAFGELVDLLCARGLAESALELEELWIALERRYDLSLLCAYSEAAVTAPSPLHAELCRLHSQVLLPSA